ncbi:MAG: hypothetical protein ACE5GM_04995 [bacterium]
MTEIENLKKAIFKYLDKINNESPKNLSHQRIEGLLNSLYMEMERQNQGEKEENLSKEEKLASMMLKVSNVLRGGNVSVCSEVADEFLKALELFELAREVKEAGKLAAIKDQYKSLKE